MNKLFRVKISRDQLIAQIELIGKLEENFSVTINDLEAFLKEKNVTFGVHHERLEEICKNPRAIQYPVVVAEGKAAVNGEDAYISVQQVEGEKKQEGPINFRNVIDIPSVKKGEVIAKIIPQTAGNNGKGVTGKLLPARDGKPLMVRAGKNTERIENEFIATIDGQVSITNKMISVNPVYEVHGDLDLKTGNIHFVGNVVIRGNVPTGYEVVAGGDIKIFGLVEGAQLVARGNIYIGGGITGGKRGKIVANGNIQANYLNQADVRAGQDVIINSSALHSKIQAGGSILCKNGHIIGGVLSAGKDIHVKELGNHLFTKTEVSVGFDPELDNKEKSLKEEEETLLENIKKLNQIEVKILEAAKQKGSISEKEKEIVLKQRTTKNELTLQLDNIKKELEEIEQERENKANQSIYIYDTVHPNTYMRFGKYIKSIQKVHNFVRFHLYESEIIFDPI